MSEIDKGKMCTCPARGIGRKAECTFRQGPSGSSDEHCSCDCHVKEEYRTGYMRRAVNKYQYLIDGQLPFPPV